MARKFLEKESTLKVEKGQARLVITFLNKSMMKNVKIKVNDEVVEIKIVNETDDKITYEFKIDSIKDDIIVSSTPFPTMNVDFRLILKENTLEKEEDLIRMYGITEYEYFHPTAETIKKVSQRINSETEEEGVKHR